MAADDDKSRHRERKRERLRGDDHYESNLKQVNNLTYKETCGACHFVYQPELLPSGAWIKILANLEDHFGETVKFDDDTKRVISDRWCGQAGNIVPRPTAVWSRHTDRR